MSFVALPAVRVGNIRPAYIISENKDKTVLNRKIEIYKNRINRRLTKFATWADDPRNEDKLLDKKLERTYSQEHGSINVQRKKDYL